MIEISRRRACRGLLVAVCFLVVASTAGQLAKWQMGHADLKGMVHAFYLDDEANVPTWYQSSTLLLAALLLQAITAVRRAAGDREQGRWQGLALLFFAMSVDETAGLHERMGEWLKDLLPASGYLHFPWVAAGLVAVLLIGLAYIPFVLRLPEPTRSRFVVAGLVFVSGALGAEVVGGHHAASHGDQNLHYAMLATLEEALEMVGILLFLRALLAHLQAQGERAQLRIID